MCFNYPEKSDSKAITLSVFLMFCLTSLVCAASDNTSQDANSQLKINRWTLLNSTDEQIRIDTAVELLKSPDAESRQILLDILVSNDNTAALSSVCRAISRFRSMAQLIPDKEDFIKPLMDIIKGQNPDAGKLAAQASLIFSYKQVKNNLEDIINNPNMSAVAKKNAVYAIQVRPDKETIPLLVDLLDSDDPVVVSAAGDALQEWMPVGTDKQLWHRIRKDLERGRIDIVRERLLAQQDKIRRLNEDISKWQKRYIVSLDSIYQATSDDSARAKFVAENLAFEQSQIKLWAIEKINMWQKSGKLLPLDVLQKPLIKLVADPDPAVRLASAKLLGLLTNVNSADALLAQLKVESNDDVKTEILIALGHVCNFAFSPGAEVKIDPQVRIDTLNIASEFLKNTKPVIMAEVIRNLLLQNGLEPSQVKPYFQLIADSFRKASDVGVKARLMEEMARLCGSDSFYKNVAGEIYKKIFIDSVDDASEQIAAPAVTGFLRVDQAKAFDVLRKKGFTSSSSSKIRAELISTAGQIGTQQDLDWLGVLLVSGGSDEERQHAADAMMNIFQYCKTDVLIVWAQQLFSQAKTKNDDFLFTKARAILEAAEKKAETEQNSAALNKIRNMLAEYYASASLYGLAAKYYGMLLLTATDPNNKEQLTAGLLNVNLRSGQTESVKQLLANTLLSSDIKPDSAVAKVVNNYFTNNPNDQMAKQMFSALAATKLPADSKRPLWTKQLEEWGKLLKITYPAPAEPNVPAGPNTTPVTLKKAQ